MVPSIDPVAFSPNGTVSLRGFTSRWVVDPITDYVPHNIMEDDEEKYGNDLDDESQVLVKISIKKYIKNILLVYVPSTKMSIGNRTGTGPSNIKV